MFDVELRLIIDGFASDDTLYRIKKGGKEPYIHVAPDDNSEAIAKKLFLDVTGLNPAWAGLKRGNWTHINGSLILDYCACICVTDRLNEEYKWESI